MNAESSGYFQMCGGLQRCSPKLSDLDFIGYCFAISTCLKWLYTDWVELNRKSLLKTSYLCFNNRFSAFKEIKKNPHAHVHLTTSRHSVLL